MIADLVDTPLARAIGWTLFHSLWEGAIVAVALLAALWMLRSSRARYLAACLAMLAIVAGFIGTLLIVQHGASLQLTALNLSIPPAPPGDDLNLRNQFARLTASDMLSWLAPFWLAGVIFFHLRGLAGWIAARRLGTLAVSAARPNSGRMRSASFAHAYGYRKRWRCWNRLSSGCLWSSVICAP